MAKEKCSRCGIEANYPLTYTDRGPLCQNCIDALAEHGPKYKEFVKAVDEFSLGIPVEHREWLESIKDTHSDKYPSEGEAVMGSARRCDISDVLFFYSLWDIGNPVRHLAYGNQKREEQERKIRNLFREAVAEVLTNECGCKNILK